MREEVAWVTVDGECVHCDRGAGWEESRYVYQYLQRERVRELTHDDDSNCARQTSMYGSMLDAVAA